MVAEIAIHVDIAIIIVAATFLAFLAKTLKQPLIPAYVIAGLLIGPLGVKLVTDSTVINSLAELGIAFMLFIVGLEISFSRLKDTLRLSSGIGIMQVLIFAIIGYLIAIFMGFAEMEAVYIGLILAFSSTLVVIKLLSDRSELDTLHGRIMLGILLTQDIVVIVVLAVLMNISDFAFPTVSIAIVRGLGLLAIAIICSKFILPQLFKFVAESGELLLLSALSWCFVFAAIAYYAGFSIAIGAFIAGVGMATFPYNLEIIGRMKSLKDFFITIFFVTLGMKIAAINIYAVLPILIILILATTILKPLIVMIMTSAIGYGRRTSFLTGVGLAHISEFSLIVAILGTNLGHIGQELLSVIIILVVVTITIGTYFIEFDKKMYSHLSGFLSIFGKTMHRADKLKHMPRKLDNHVIVCGAHRMGSQVVEILQKLKENFIVIDFDPGVIKNLINRKISCIYGDIDDVEILKRAKLRKAKMVISTIPDQTANLLLVDVLKKTNPKALIFVVAGNSRQALDFYDKGVNYVIIPQILSGEMAASLVRKLAKKTANLENLKQRHIEELKELLQEYKASEMKHKDELR